MEGKIDRRREGKKKGVGERGEKGEGAEGGED